MTRHPEETVLDASLQEGRRTAVRRNQPHSNLSRTDFDCPFSNTSIHFHSHVLNVCQGVLQSLIPSLVSTSKEHRVLSRIFYVKYGPSLYNVETRLSSGWI